jgi:hypothetical protein
MTAPCLNLSGHKFSFRVAAWPAACPPDPNLKSQSSNDSEISGMRLYKMARIPQQASKSCEENNYLLLLCSGLFGFLVRFL